MAVFHQVIPMFLMAYYKQEEELELSVHACPAGLFYSFRPNSRAMRADLRLIPHM
jgi:hypothetical protein